MPRIEIESKSYPSVWADVATQDRTGEPEVTLVVHREGSIGLMDYGLLLEWAHERFAEPDDSDQLTAYADQILAPHPKSGRYVEAVPSYRREGRTWLLVLETVHGDRLHAWDLSGGGFGELAERTR